MQLLKAIGFLLGNTLMLTAATGAGIFVFSKGVLKYALLTQHRALSQPRGVGWGCEWDGDSRRKGIYVYLELIHTAALQKSAQHCKAINSHSKNFNGGFPRGSVKRIPLPTQKTQD